MFVHVGHLTRWPTTATSV